MQQADTTIWCLLGENAAENSQVTTLAHSLARPFEIKQIKAHRWELLVHLGHGATLAGIDQAASSPLTAPWPALAFSASRCAEPVGQWIRRQSGGRTRLVHIGRPWAPPEHWDLLISTAQYCLPQRANVLSLSLPLHASPVGAAGGAETPQAQFAALPRPWIALLPGADHGPFVLTESKAAALGDLADKLAAATGGSLLYCDQPGTPWPVGAAITGQLRGDNFIHHAESDAGLYRDIVDKADAIILSGASPGRLAEAAASGRPLLLFDCAEGASGWWKLAHNYRPGPLQYHLLQKALPRRLQRDPVKLQRNLLATGRALRLRASALPEAARYILKPRDTTTVEFPQATAAAELASAAAAVSSLLGA